MLDATPKKILERKSGGMINPAKTCQPIGAMYAALGITEQGFNSGDACRVPWA